MKDILSYGCRFDNLETEITIKPLDDDLAGFETTLKKEFIRKISFNYYSNVYIIKGYYPNNDVDECFKGVELERWASLKNNRKEAVKKVRIRWIRGKHVDRETEFNACAIKYKEKIDRINHHFYLLLVDVDKEREIGYNNIITVNNSDLLYLNIKPYREDESLNSVLRKLDNKYTSISDLKGNYALLDNLAKTKIATERSITSEEYWKMKLLVFSLSTEFKSVSFELNINFNKDGYDGLVNNGRPLNILRRIISVLSRHISNEAIKDVEKIKENIDTKKVFLSRQLKEKVREIIKREDLIIQPRLNSIRVCKNNNGGGTGMSMSQGSSSRIIWGEEVDINQIRLQQKAVNTENPDFHQKLTPRPAEKEFSLNNDEELSLWEELCEGVSFTESKDFSVIKIKHDAVKNNSIEISTYINEVNETLGETVERLSKKKKIIAAVNGTFFSPPYKAFGHIVNNGKDETLYDEINKGLGYKKAFVKNRSFFAIDKRGYSFIGEADYNRGNILNNNPNLKWALGGLAKLKENEVVMDTEKLTTGRDESDLGQGPGFEEGQLYSTHHMMMGKNKDNDIFIFMNKSKMGIKNGNGIFQFINTMGLTDVVKLDGGGSTQMYTNNDYYFQYRDRNIPNMILITVSD